MHDIWLRRGGPLFYFASIPGVLNSRYLHGVSLKLSLGLHREMALMMALDLAALHQNQHQRWKLSLSGWETGYINLRRNILDGPSCDIIHFLCEEYLV